MAYSTLRHRLLARCYDRMMCSAESAFLGDVRARLLADARGEVLEIGGGTGANLAKYGDDVHSLDIVEPDPNMAARLHERLGETPTLRARVSVTETSAETLPFDDRSFDSVVATLTLCSISDPDRALREIHRVMRPTGRFFFIEHVRSKRLGVGRFQDRAESAWSFITTGCHPNRETAALIGAAGLRVETHTRHELAPKAGLVRDFIWGTAEAT